MKRLLISAGFALAMAISATPAFAQESLFSVEKPSEPIALAPLDMSDTRRAPISILWDQFSNAVLSNDQETLKILLRGKNGTALSDKALDKTLYFLTKDPNSPFVRTRLYASMSSITHPSYTHILGWQPPASLSLRQRELYERNPQAEAIACMCTGADCQKSPPKNIQATSNYPDTNLACARIILGRGQNSRIEVDIPPPFTA